MGFVCRALLPAPNCNPPRQAVATLRVRGPERSWAVPTPGGTPADNREEDGGDDQTGRADPGAGTVRSRDQQRRKCRDRELNGESTVAWNGCLTEVYEVSKGQGL
jgi:hypothetical protein